MTRLLGGAPLGGAGIDEGKDLTRDDVDSKHDTKWSRLLHATFTYTYWTDQLKGDDETIPNNDFSHYIVGGTEVAPGARPYQVGLIDNGQTGEPFCGGSLIAEDWVLTAAHCVTNTDVEAIVVMLGTENFNGIGGETRRVSCIIVHEGYKGNTNSADIALIQLSVSASNIPNVAPVTMAALANNVDALTGKPLVISGWGTTSSGGQQSNVMLEADVIGISQATCSGQYGGGIDDGMVCAAAPGKDSCQGDSGGPMVDENGGDPILEGVVSFGEGCADPDYAGVYTRVSFYRNWVDSMLQLTTCPSPPSNTDGPEPTSYTDSSGPTSYTDWSGPPQHTDWSGPPPHTDWSGPPPHTDWPPYPCPCPCDHSGPPPDEN
ncbi:PREDICTED: trypsin-like [Priapulus caudatus]|uniref:Trypsin-like n=1 Tax=Priapulus caudatus TaxID=37621 RepID=A0ABM1E472_PRICU|nr:PREDICTED: trypsin-like [Priapulus caudatus]